MTTLCMLQMGTTHAIAHHLFESDSMPSKMTGPCMCSIKNSSSINSLQSRLLHSKYFQLYCKLSQCSTQVQVTCQQPACKKQLSTAQPCMPTSCLSTKPSAASTRTSTTTQSPHAAVCHITCDLPHTVETPYLFRVSKQDASA